mgnify:CR=1 FL=1
MTKGNLEAESKTTAAADGVEQLRRQDMRYGAWVMASSLMFLGAIWYLFSTKDSPPPLDPSPGARDRSGSWDIRSQTPFFFYEDERYDCVMFLDTFHIKYPGIYTCFDVKTGSEWWVKKSPPAVTSGYGPNDCDKGPVKNKR